MWLVICDADYAVACSGKALACSSVAPVKPMVLFLSCYRAKLASLMPFSSVDCRCMYISLVWDVVSS